MTEADKKIIEAAKRIIKRAEWIIQKEGNVANTDLAVWAGAISHEVRTIRQHITVRIMQAQPEKDEKKTIWPFK